MTESVTGILLAGGEGQRMGGLDKGLQLFAGRPMVELMLDALGGVCANILISANRNLEIYQRYGHKVVADGRVGFEGPLAGLMATMPYVTDEYVVFVPCDVPRLGGVVLPRLFQSLLQSGVDVCIAADAERIHYSIAVCRTQAALQALCRTWEDGQRSLRAWQQLLRRSVVQFEDASLFVNCNVIDRLDHS